VNSASLTTWTTQLTTLERRAGEHERLATELILQVADPLHNVAAKYEQLRRNHAEYAGRLEKEKDEAYSMYNTKSGYSNWDVTCHRRGPAACF